LFDLNTEEKLFNEFIIPGVTAEIKARSKLFDRVKKNYKKVDVSGKYAKQKLLLAGSQATGARSNSSYPTAQESSVDEAIIYIKRAQMFSMQFDGLALESAKGKGTPVDAFNFEQEGLFIQVSEDLSRQLMLDGSGHLAQINGDVTASATVTVDSPYYSKATIFLKANRVLDGDPANGDIDSVAISKVDSDTQITMKSAVTIHDDDWLFGEDTYTASETWGKGEMMGLAGIISNADPPAPNDNGLQGLAVGDYPEWAAYVDDHSGTPRDLTETMMTKAFDEISMYAEPSVILTTHGVRRFYANLLTSYKGIYNQKVLWGGWSGLPFVYDGREIPVVVDKFVPDGWMFIVSEKHLTLYATTPGIISFEKGTAGRYMQKVANKNEYVAEGHFFGNLGTDLRRAFGVIKDLNES